MGIVIETAVLEEAREFFEECGSVGREGAAMIIGREGFAADRLLIPDQRGTPAPYCSVEVTWEGKLQMAAALAPGDRYVARIHSHCLEAFHSPMDDRNPALTFQGAVSIVVPYFGLGLRHGLEACALYQLRDRHWVALAPGSERDEVVRVAG
jgi:hypothetical protein